LYGSGSSASWTLSTGPRYAVGAGPTAVAIQDVGSRNGTATPDGVADLVVTNSGSNNLTILPGIGTPGNPSGFFAGVGNGAFNRALPSPAPQPLPQPIPAPLPPPIDPGIAIDPLPNGGLVRVLPSLAIQPIFTPPPGLLPTSFAFNASERFLFVGTNGGGIE